MKFKYIGDAMISLKTPCPVTGQLVDLHTGDTVELDWKPGGHPQTLVLVEEEAVLVDENEPVHKNVGRGRAVKTTKPKKVFLGRKPKDK